MTRFPIRLSAVAAAAAVAAFMLGPLPAASAGTTAGITAPGVPGSPDGATTPAATIASDSAVEFAAPAPPALGNEFSCVVVDSARGYAYFGTDTAPGRVVKVKLGADDGKSRVVAKLTLPAGCEFLKFALIDAVAGYVYCGASGGVLAKVALGDGDTTPILVGRSSLLNFSGFFLPAPSADYVGGRITCGAIDPAAGFAYIGAFSEYSIYSAPDFPPAAAGAVVPSLRGDSQRFPTNQVYLSTTVVKVALGSGSTGPFPMSETGVSLDTYESIAGTRPAERTLRSAVMDSATGHAYMGLDSLPPLVLKIAGGGVGVAPELEATLILSSDDLVFQAAFDPVGGHAYFGGGPWLTKVALGTGTSAPVRVGRLRMPAESGDVQSIAVDPGYGYAYVGTSYAAAGTSSPANVVQVALGGAGETPTVVGTASTNDDERYLRCAAVDGAGGFAYFGSSAFFGVGGNRIERFSLRPARPLAMTRMTMPERGAVGAFRFYSHRPAGNLALALYDDASPRALRWRGGPVVNTAAGAALSIPVSAGVPPALILDAGTYHLAWQADTTTEVGSVATGAAGTGLTVPGVRFGRFPAAVDPATSGAATTDNWTESLVYEPVVSQPSVVHGFETPAGGGVPAGFSALTLLGDGSAVEYDSTGTALVARLAAGPGFRLAGWFTLARDRQLPVSTVGPDRIARARFAIHAAGQTNPAAYDTIPNMRLRLASRFAVTSMLEILHHTAKDPGNTTLAAELRPSTDPARPSIYTVDFDPVDVPYYAVDPTEGLLAGFEAYGTDADPGDNGGIVVSEITLGSYPKSFVPDSAAPVRVMSSGPGGGDFGPVGASTNAFNAQGLTILNDPPGLLATADLTDTGTVLSAANVPADRIGIVGRDFPVGLDASPANRLRVEPGRQYHVRFHLTSTQATSLNGQITVRARSAKFAYVHKLQVGGGNPTNNVAGQTIARQALPGPGGANPDNDGVSDIGRGGWYNLVVRTPLDPEIRGDGAPGATIGQLMPTFFAEPGSGDPTPNSRRDLRVGIDLFDTQDAGANAANEVGQVAVDRIEFRSYPAVGN